MITVVNFGLSKNVRFEKRDYKFTLIYMDKQTKPAKSCDLIILYTKSCRVFKNSDLNNF